MQSIMKICLLLHTHSNNSTMNQSSTEEIESASATGFPYSQERGYLELLRLEVSRGRLHVILHVVA
jgi:hypothetical protein